MFLLALSSHLHRNNLLSYSLVEPKRDPSMSKVVQQLGFVILPLLNREILTNLFSRGFSSKSVVMFHQLKTFSLRDPSLLNLHGLNPYEDQISVTLKPSPFVSFDTLMCFMFVSSRDVCETSIHELIMRYSVC